jgi:hypothetical protein
MSNNAPLIDCEGAGDHFFTSDGVEKRAEFSAAKLDGIRPQKSARKRDETSPLKRIALL